EIAVAPGPDRLARHSALQLAAKMRRLLMRRLRPRRHDAAVMTTPRAGRAIAKRENVLVARCLQRRQHDELVGAVDLQAIEPTEHLRRLHACRPYHELGGN